MRKIRHISFNHRAPYASTKFTICAIRARHICLEIPYRIQYRALIGTHFFIIIPIFQMALKWFLLVTLMRVSFCQDGGELYPCHTKLSDVVYSNDSDTVVVSLNDTYCKQTSSSSSSSSKAYVIHSDTNATNGSTMVMVALRGRSLVTWTLPLTPQSFTTQFMAASHTLVMCPVAKAAASIGPPFFFIEISTDSPTPLNYSLSVTTAENFELGLNTEYTTNVTITLTQIFYFNFPDDVGAVTVDVMSNSDACTSVSAQSTSTCPPNDLLYNPLSKLLQQTMTTSAFLTVMREDLDQPSFFLIFREVNYSVCHTHAAFVPGTVKEMKFIMKELKPASLFSAAIIAPIGLFAIIILFTCAVYSSCCCIKTCYWTPLHKFSTGETAYAICYCPDTSHSTTIDAAKPAVEMKQEQDMGRNYGSLDNLKRLAGSQQNPNIQDHSQDVPPSRAQSDTDIDPLTSSIFMKPDNMLHVPSLAKRNFDSMQLQYAVYAWNTMTVGIFYALPAFQLVLSQQLSLRTNGNEDQCYYNFKCAIPYGVLSAFNNVWSNVGYVLFGVAFICIIAMRELKFKWLKRKSMCVFDNNGLPQFFGVYYALGISLVIEGFMSGFYHICPSDANFQFDTAFMFIIGGLLLVKVFQNRHPDFHANAFVAFFSFAVVILFTLSGIYYDKADPLAVRLFLLTIVLVAMSVFLFSLYYYHQWNYIWKALKNFIQQLKCKTCSRTELKEWCIPRRKVAFIKFLVVLVFNAIVALIFIAQRQTIGIATVILIYFLFNSNIFLMFYVISKLYYREPCTLVCGLMLLLAGLSWSGALYFYFSNVSQWSWTPAESRQLNKSCILFNFYDNHDVWHFLSAAAMFFSFMFILTLDDGLENVPRENINTF